jgi:hypothetical protein
MPKAPQDRISLQDVDARKYYCSGFSLYAASSLMANPYLLVKRRQQLGMQSGLLRIYASEGLRSLFRGGTLCWVSGCNRMAYFTVYEHVTNLLEHVTSRSNGSCALFSHSSGKESISRGVAGE